MYTTTPSVESAQRSNTLHTGYEEFYYYHNIKDFCHFEDNCISLFYYLQTKNFAQGIDWEEKDGIRKGYPANGSIPF